MSGKIAHGDRRLHSNFEYVNLMLINIDFLRQVSKNRVKEHTAIYGSNHHEGLKTFKGFYAK